MNLWPILGVVALAYFALSDSATVEELSDVMKRVTVGSRSYLVTRLGGGVYNVTTTDAKASISFGQQGISSELGDSKSLSQLKEDLYRFPKDLFT